MKIKTADLIGPALDWAVDVCEGGGKPFVPDWNDAHSDGGALWFIKGYSTIPNYGLPILEREKIELTNWAIDGWKAHATDYSSRPDDEAFAEAYGPTMLIAGLRCFVASRLGDEVDVPEEMLS
jgi:hypothetical protein